MITKDRRTYDMTDNDRRQQEDIERMIAEEQDPKIRLNLMVLNKINLALIANTTVTNTIRKDLDAHLLRFEARAKEQDEMVNKGKGAWWVIVSVLAVAQLLIGFIWMTVRDDLKNIRADINAVAIEQAKRTARIQNIENIIEYVIKKGK